ncbi:PD-(D/E)XK nuclease-like domain-containing protein [Halomonas sp. IOP_31]|uniref:PD-(D/E)XK nuclease-like domain-containing protein n=1 Tax=Halomonas sp. IOP_31 TaxID=2876584 RepID=UPI001E643187|nr:PD-(D/E)XK nuclease-like domain-containing protein [Halomonas sp. IOP_31]MCD6006863.1 PD-(D/E)XK nuclease-like domain-containing protein [Halomonas sp. IOP_31]
MQPEIIEPGYYRDLDNERYHASSAVSKSQLDLLHKSPALLQWSRTAPEDDEKKTALNVGDACHALILEPHRFDAEYAIGPDAPKNTKEGKSKWANFEECLGDKTVLTHAEGRKVKLIRESVMAHPHARWLVESEGDVEASIYWRDSMTNQLCRCRPDKALPDMGWLLDVKTTADMSKFAKSVYEYRYHVQDAFYSDGYAQHFGTPIKAFLFLVVSTSIECGRYPVRLFTLDQAAKDAGRFAAHRDMQTYAECMDSGVWPGIETLSLPPWAE